MSGFLDHLNLRPQERRILVITLAVVVIVLNAVFVWPHYKDWQKVDKETQALRATLANHRAEVARLPEYRARLAKLEGTGSSVLPESQALQLQAMVQSYALSNNVALTSLRPGSAVSSTNTFFDEQTVIIGVNTGDKELVDFLLALGAGNSMIRVRDLDLRPDSPLYKLVGNITVSASYQKQAKAQPAPKAPAQPTPNPKKL